MHLALFYKLQEWHAVMYYGDVLVSNVLLEGEHHVT